MREIAARPLTPSAFAPFGEVLDCAGEPDRIINRGLCGRWHDRATLDMDDAGRPGISLFLAEPRALPYTLDLVERHPEGSQAFVPMHEHPWLVIVAAEMLVGGTGIGYYVWNEWNNLDLNSVIFSILMIGLVGMCLDMILGSLEKLVQYKE